MDGFNGGEKPKIKTGALREGRQKGKGKHRETIQGCGGRGPERTRGTM